MRNDITMETNREMAGVGNNNLPEPWWYNRDNADIDTDEVGYNPSPMSIYTEDTRMSDYW